MNPELPVPNSGLQDQQLLPLVLKQFLGCGACRDGAHCPLPLLLCLDGTTGMEGSQLILPLCHAADQPNSIEQPPVPPLLTQQGTGTSTCPKATVQCCAMAKKTITPSSLSLLPRCLVAQPSTSQPNPSTMAQPTPTAA